MERTRPAMLGPGGGDGEHMGALSRLVEPARWCRAGPRSSSLAHGAASANGLLENGLGQIDARSDLVSAPKLAIAERHDLIGCRATSRGRSTCSLWFGGLCHRTIPPAPRIAGCGQIENDVIAGEAIA